MPTEVLAELEPVAIRIERPFAHATGRHRPHIRCRTWVEARQGFRDVDTTWDEPNVPERPRDDHPATCIDWHDARAYAARGGTAGAGSWSNRDSHEGVSISRACDHAIVYAVSARAPGPPVPHARCTDGYPGLAPAGSFLPNPCGLYDTIGNLRERLADCFTRSYKGGPADGRAWRWDGCPHDAVRGGTWRSRASAARSAARDFDGTELANDAR